MTNAKKKPAASDESRSAEDRLDEIERLLHNVTEFLRLNSWVHPDETAAEPKDTQ